MGLYKTYFIEDNKSFEKSFGICQDCKSSENIEVKSVNSPPIANDQSLKTNKGTPLKIKLTGSDPEDDP